MEALDLGRRLTSGTLSLLTLSEDVLETNKQVRLSALCRLLKNEIHGYGYRV